jgi:hypothetical protein
LSDLKKPLVSVAVLAARQEALTTEQFQADKTDEGQLWKLLK